MAMLLPPRPVPWQPAAGPLSLESSGSSPQARLQGPQPCLQEHLYISHLQRHKSAKGRSCKEMLPLHVLTLLSKKVEFFYVKKNLTENQEEGYPAPR